MSGAWAALDPGRQKCGLVRTDASGTELVDLLICSPREAWDWLQHWQHQAPLQGVVLGDGTASGPWHQALAELEPAVSVVLQPCLLYTSPSPRDYAASRMPSSA